MSRSRRGKLFSAHFPVGRRLIPFVCGLAVLFGTTASARQPTYDVHYENRTVISALDDLKARTGHLFLHQDGVISDTERVTVRLTGATLPQILDKILVEKGYRYRIDGRDVVIIRAAAPAAQPAPQPQQPRTVTGSVTDEQNQPLAGVAVQVKGDTKGVVTDGAGNFTLDLIPGQVLLFSYLGMMPQEIRITDQLFVHVTLLEEATEIEQAVVIGYGSARKLGSMAGSVATIGGDKIKDVPVANFSDALQGKIAGLSVLNSSGEPSSTASIRLRGVNSILAGVDPLYILDGSPVSQVVFHSLNPGDIETIVTLKDASATAIYGSRAANGVIAITTKKDRNNEEATVSLRA
ncbi:MAG: TonB-dependent receptor plug domain-containing protein [Rikenellaceae bacterium]|nr:TonB-dependent receptor plug domain-containing protein [Rikenellaceae bacterium]